MNEDFLHYIWKFGLFDQTNLKTSSGEIIEIVKPGEHNFDSGPDFFNAHIKINGTLWVGNVEIHIHSSDWHKHKHQQDKAYNNVILHVVFSNDAENHVLRVQAKNERGDFIPELELKFRIFPHVKSNYELLKKSTKSFACAGLIKRVDEATIHMWLERMLIERLEKKINSIDALFESNNKDWQETFYQLLAKNFGFKTNADAFYLLAKSLPLNILLKHKNELFQLESLLFGQAGMLDEPMEAAYAHRLQNEYEFLRKKYSLIPIKKESWKYLRMRPVNFPTIRIAQFAALIHSSSHLFSRLLEGVSVTETRKLFEASASEFWNGYYSFTSVSKKGTKMLGKDAIENILINTVAPLLFYYGKKKHEQIFCDRAVDLLAEVEGENNKITREYVQAGVGVKNAIHSQGLIHLNKEYCKQFGCLNCSIGNKLLKN